MYTFLNVFFSAKQVFQIYTELKYVGAGKSVTQVYTQWHVDEEKSLPVSLAGKS